MKFFLLIFVITKISFSDVLTPESLIDSVDRHYPAIKEALLKKELAYQNLLEAKGALDSTIQIKGDKFLSGYYEGSSLNARIEKPLQFMNSKIFSGYRVSDDKFPTYEGKVNTLSAGEFFIGAQVELLRYRNMNKNTLNIELGKLDQTKAENDFQIKKILTKRKALIAYWNWYISGLKLDVYENLVEVSQSRVEAFRQKLKLGDIAEIKLIENQQYLIQRKNQLKIAKQKFYHNSLKISLFLRNSQGEPQAPIQKKFPEINLNKILNKLKTVQETDNKSLIDNPLFSNLNIDQYKIEKKIQFYENFLIPKLSLKVLSSKDYGEGLKQLKTHENRVSLNIEIPLERRLGKSKLRKAKIKDSIIKNNLKYEIDVIKTQHSKYINDLKVLEGLITNSIKEISLSKKLVESERFLLSNGSSNFFTLNIREQNLAKDKLKQLNYLNQIKTLMINYKTLIWVL